MLSLWIYDPEENTPARRQRPPIEDRVVEGLKAVSREVRDRIEPDLVPAPVRT